MIAIVLCNHVVFETLTSLLRCCPCLVYCATRFYSLISGLKPLKTCKLARLSCLFKDTFAHRLLSNLEELIGPPKEGDSVENQGTSCGSLFYRRWSPDLVRLPAEMLFYLLGFLNPPDLVAAGTTCRLMLGACRQPLLWRRHYVARFGLPRVPTLIGFNWYEQYVRSRIREHQVHLMEMLGARVVIIYY